MANTNTTTKIISGLIWKLLESSGAQGIQFLIQLILARLLLPEDYGLLALMTIFISVANVFVQSGFSTALIQRKDVEEADFSSVFYISLLLAFILYLILFFSAPLIAAFYEEPALVSVLRVFSLTLFFGAANAVQSAVVSRTMQFKRFFFSSLGAALISGLFGIALAYNGAGIWALVIQQLVSSATITLILWFTVNWRPRRLFSISRVRILFSFGWKILLSGLLNVLYANLRGLVIGKVYHPSILGYYNRANQFPNLIIANISGSMSSVLLPVMSASQENRQQVRNMTRRSIITSSFLIFPIMMGLAVCAKPIVRLLLTDRWLPSVPFIYLFCLAYAFFPMHTANLEAVNALGRSDIFLKIEVIKQAFSLAALFISIPFGIVAMVAAEPVLSFLCTFINAYPAKKLLDYSWSDQCKDLLPSLILTLAMGAVIYPIEWIGLNDFPTLALQILAGLFFYMGTAALLKMEPLIYTWRALRPFLNVKKNPSAPAAHSEKSLEPHPTEDPSKIKLI